MSSGEQTWAECWGQLSPQARAAVVRDVKAPTKKDSVRPPYISAGRLPANVVEELTAGGYVERRPGPSPRQPERLVVPPDAVDFVHRVQHLARWRLLQAEGPERLPIYVHDAFYGPNLERDIRPVLRQGEIHDSFVSRGILLGQYVISHHWPEWAAKSLRQPLAEALLHVIEEAGGVLPLDDLPVRLPESKPNEVRDTVAALVQMLALFVDLRPDTLELLIGLLTPVREALRRARQPQRRPDLVAAAEPQDQLPEGGYELDDLRTFLVELASAPARLRQNHTLFQKEQGRFESALEPLPAWTTALPRLTVGLRLHNASRWCHSLGLTRAVQRNGIPWLELTRDGQAWLAADVAAQYRQLFDFLRGGQDQDFSYSYYAGDVLFLGVPLLAAEAQGKTSSWWVQMKAADRDKLRQAFYAAFAELSPGQFVRLDSFLAHATFGPHNPLSLGGLELRRVTVVLQNSPVPPLEEQRQTAGRRSLEMCITERLLPLGCLRAGVEADGSVCVARHPRLDAYFGRPVSDEVLGGPAQAGARVLVQPDFSVIILGSMPAAAAELAPFCERSGGRGVQGTLQLKITRSAVVGAVAGGLSGQEIEERLTRHSSVPVPANVLHEVREWAGWVRTAAVSTMVVLRCPDRATADRAASVLGRQVERLSDTLVALPTGALSGAERTKLQQHGILISTPKGAASTSARTRKRRS